ncbi:MAG TPA: hypothetical protein VM370_07370 [Candidatus Thermoplasmatota archaeon]|nr:hypothetical protein [Candidatus Thermoplasmatota archaeon]
MAALLSMPSFAGAVLGSDPTCGTGAPVTATSGGGDAALPSLQYAALKTGFRAVVTWETPTLERASLRYSVDAGSVTTLSENVPRTVHVFVIDSLPVGRSLCFTPFHEGGAAAGGAHAMKLANAMNAFDGASYTFNYLVLANEQSSMIFLERSLDDFAEKVYDYTDGHVRAGRIITIVGDYERHNAGWPTCVLANVPGCAWAYDVIFTFGADPVGAASTNLDGVTLRQSAIWMNWYHQAGLVSTGDDTGTVLAHETGHYLFGLLDEYGSVTGTSPDCWDPEKELSVMGGNRAASEIDDAVNRCPNEASLADYDPSWGRLRERYPAIPERTVIDAGPVGHGGAYVRSTLEVTPAVSRVGIPSIEDPQDDAGSGADAGSFPWTATPIDTGVEYTATFLPPLDGADVFVFDAAAGAAIEVGVTPRTVCFVLQDADYANVAGSCTFDGATMLRHAVSDGRPMYVKFLTGTSPVYRFGVGVDAPAPPVTG